MRAWYVVRVKPRQEQQLMVVLNYREIETYFPEIQVKARHGTPEKTEPLFPGYLFTRLDAETPEWMVARSAPGVSYFLGLDRVPTPVPDSLVDEIRRRVALRSGKLPPPKYKPGQRLKIVDGPLHGLEAIFDGTLSSTGRSRVLVMIVGRLSPVHVNLGQLAPKD